MGIIGILLRYILPMVIMGISIQAMGGSYESRECLECHGERGIFSVLYSGERREISIDLDSWKRDVHNLNGIKCVDCHIEASPRSHPRGGYPKVDCTRCHPEECEAFQTTVHKKREGISEKEIPLCHDCHGKHEVGRANDPRSTVHMDRIRDTCRKCHGEIASGGVLERLAQWRISGHRKEDVSRSFDIKACTFCHHEDAVHGEEIIYKGICNDCHKPRVKGAMLGVTHLIPEMKKQPITFFLKFIDGIVALGIFFAIVSFLVVRYRYKCIMWFRKGKKV
jgi:hypothetical protein